MTNNNRAALTVSLLGAGTVGSSLLRRLQDDTRFRVGAVLVRDPGRDRGVELPGGTVTTDPQEAVAAGDVVVELMGGTGLAADLMLGALAGGRHVVTGNKAALAERWDEFRPHAAEGRLHYEAAVLAGTPAVAPLAGVLRGSEPLQLDAVLNGTCSYIIDRLGEGVAFAEALKTAQELGYAEADPTLDIGGFDAAHKLTVLGRLAFDPLFSWEEVKAATRGIESLTPELVGEARADGFSTVLLCSIVPGPDGWEALVRPAFLPQEHPLGRLGAGHNGFVFRGRQAGTVSVTGPGAGGDSTASAVLADLQSVLAGTPGPLPPAAAADLPRDYAPELFREVEAR